MLVGSTRYSSTARRTAGDNVVMWSSSRSSSATGAVESPRSAGVSPAPAGFVVAAAALAAGLDAGGAALAVAFWSIRAITAPTATVSPSPANCSVRTPATGDGTSTLTLSVSRLAIGSSAATASPGFFNHCASVPSVIDSPSAGTSTSVAIGYPYSAAAAVVAGLLWPRAAAIKAACSAA